MSEAGVYVFGDWRDLRRAVERTDPEWMKLPEAERERLWAFAKGVLANYAPHHPKCIDCRKVMEPWEVYRCADCNAPLCEGCIKPHFGPNHRPHTREDDADELRDLLHDLVQLESERWALNGGGPGWGGRWEEAMRRATEKFTP